MMGSVAEGDDVRGMDAAWRSDLDSEWLSECTQRIIAISYLLRLPSMLVPSSYCTHQSMPD